METNSQHKHDCVGGECQSCGAVIPSEPGESAEQLLSDFAKDSPALNPYPPESHKGWSYTRTQVTEFAELYAATLRAQLQERDTRIQRLREKVSKLIEGLPNYSASSSMYQRVEAVKATLKEDSK